MTTFEETEKGPRKQADRVRDMQDRLIAATVVCLDRYGYSGTSISAIQDAAGVSRGAILHHYPSRQELIAATAARLLDAALRPTQEGRPGRGDGAKNLEELLLFYWRRKAGPSSKSLWPAARTKRWNRRCPISSPPGTRRSPKAPAIASPPSPTTRKTPPSSGRLRAHSYAASSFIPVSSMTRRISKTWSAVSAR
jgi:AcrR family transcriptional regulator